MRTGLLALALMAAAPAMAQNVVETSIEELQAKMALGTTSEAITKEYLERITAMDRKGPTLRSVIAVTSGALDQARASDARRKGGKLLGPLDGIPVLIKDNIETWELPT
ncbi:MAG: amidase, partial [Burkholderiales bacterium]